MMSPPTNMGNMALGVLLLLVAGSVGQVKGQDWAYIANSLDPGRNVLGSWYNGQDACTQAAPFKVSISCVVKRRRIAKF